MQAFDCTARWLTFVGLRISMVRNLQKQLQSNCTAQRMLSAADERRARVDVGRVGGRWAEPVIRSCHALYHAARRRQAWSRAGDAPSFYLPGKEVAPRPDDSTAEVWLALAVWHVEQC